MCSIRNDKTQLTKRQSFTLHVTAQLVGLSKERPILGHHAKANILKSGGFHVKSAGFHADFMKSARFHVKSKDHLQGIVTLCFDKIDYRLKLGYLLKSKPAV